MSKNYSTSLASVIPKLKQNNQVNFDCPEKKHEIFPHTCQCHLAFNKVETFENVKFGVF
jgi:hypothetical protein